MKRTCVVAFAALLGLPWLVNPAAGADRGWFSDLFGRDRDKDNNRRDRDDDRFNERSVEMRDLPDNVRQTIERERREMRGDARVEDVTQITRNGRTFYRVHIEGRDEEDSRTLRVAPNGALLSQPDRAVAWGNYNLNEVPRQVRRTIEQVARNQPVNEIILYKKDGFDYYRARLSSGEVFRVDPQGDVLNYPRFLSNIDRGRGQAYDRELDLLDRESRGRLRPVNFDNLPGPVKGAVGQRMGRNQRVTSAAEVRDGGQPYYRIEVQGANQRSITYRVTPNGEMLGAENTTPEGRVRIGFDSLPGDVKRGLLQEAGREQNVRDVYQVTRNNRTFYVARVRERDGSDKWVWINNHGSVVQERDAR